jgi:hypothetical protein
VNIRFISDTVNAISLKVNGRVSKLKIESRGLFATSVFYAVAGAILLVLLSMSGFPPHLAVMGVFSLVAAYGLFMKRTWAIWFVLIMFFVATTFSAFILYYVFGTDPVADVGLLAYLVLTWIFTAYVISKRKALES